MSKQQIDFKEAVGSTISDIKISRDESCIIIEFSNTYSVLESYTCRMFSKKGSAIRTNGVIATDDYLSCQNKDGEQ